MALASFPPVAHCLVSVRRVSGQRYSAFETGGLRVHRIARRTQVRLRMRVLRNPPRLKGMRSAAAPNLVAHGTFWPWGRRPRPHRSLRAKPRLLPRHPQPIRVAVRRRGIPRPSPACASARLTRTVAAPSPCDRSSSASHGPDPRCGGVSVRHGLRSPAFGGIAWCRPASRLGAAERKHGVSETNPDKRGSWTLPAANGFRRGECLVTACWRDALPRAIPDCRDRTPARQRRRMARQTSAPSRILQHYRFFGVPLVT